MPWTLIPAPTSQVLASQDIEGTQMIFNFYNAPSVWVDSVIFPNNLSSLVLKVILLFILWNFHTYITSIEIISAPATSLRSHYTPMSLPTS